MDILPVLSFNSLNFGVGILCLFVFNFLCSVIVNMDKHRNGVSFPCNVASWHSGKLGGL